MKPFRAARDGSLRARFDDEELDLLVHLATGAAELAATVASDEPDLYFDPALVRLLPDAYPGDGAASAEFRRFTAKGLAERKVLNARVVVESLESSVDTRAEVRLDGAQAAAWLRALTDIRLVLAARLGILQDGDEGDVHDADTAFQRAVYDWLAGVQESLVLALHSTPR